MKAELARIQLSVGLQVGLEEELQILLSSAGEFGARARLEGGAFGGGAARGGRGVEAEGGGDDVAHPRNRAILHDRRAAAARGGARVSEAGDRVPLGAADQPRRGQASRRHPDTRVALRIPQAGGAAAGEQRHPPSHHEQQRHQALLERPPQVDHDRLDRAAGGPVLCARRSDDHQHLHWRQETAGGGEGGGQ